MNTKDTECSVWMAVQECLEGASSNSWSGENLEGLTWNGGSQVAPSKAGDFIRLAHKRTLESALSIGKFLLDTFFNGNFEEYTHITPNKKVVFEEFHHSGAILESGLSISTLRSYIRLYNMRGDFPEGLKLSHYVALSRLPSKEDRHVMGQWAVEENLSVKELERLIMELRPAKLFQGEGR